MRHRTTLLGFPPLLGAPASAQRAPLWNVGIEDKRAISYLIAAVGEGKVVFVSGAEVTASNFERAIVAALDTTTGLPLWVEEGEEAAGEHGTKESAFTQLVLTKSSVVVGGQSGRARDTRESRHGRGGAPRARPEDRRAPLDAEGPRTPVAPRAGRGGWKRRSPRDDRGRSRGADRPPRRRPSRDGYAALGRDHGPDAGNPLLAGAAAAGRRVAIVGEQVGDGEPGDSDLFVRVQRHEDRCSRLGRGVRRWTTSASPRPTVLAKGRRLFVGGAEEREGPDQDYLVRAYDLATGNVRWTQTAPLDGSDRTTALALTGSTLLSYTEPTFSGGTLRAHDVRTGLVRWDEDFAEESVVFGMGAKGRRVVVPQVNATFGLDTKTGARVFEGTVGGLLATIVGNQVFVATRTGTASFDTR